MELDSVNMPLEGITLIEAAAGTGKTHNIQNIAARLIVECNYPINKVVIVTFTELAARELSERLRSVLESLLKVLQGEVVADVNQQQRATALLQAFSKRNITCEQQLERVRNALADFDDNRVSTIHGFCARILNENAFESSVLFRTRLEKNIDQYVDKLLGDYCRMKRYGNSPWTEAHQASREMFADYVKFLLYRNNLKCEYNCQLFESEEALTAALAKLIAELKNMPGASAVLRNIPGNFNKIGDRSGKEHIDFYAGKLEELLECDADPLEFIEVMRNIKFDVLSKSISKKQKNHDEVYDYIESERLFTLAEEFCQICEVGSRIMMENEAYRFVRKKLEEWKKRDNFHSFDDMLKNVLAALKNEQLCKLLRDKFNAALIDEFQDTDPVQYAIFKKIFISGSQKHSFFMVGDPRQAIYSFRGGDLATYMMARRECLAAPDGRIYKLSCNYRSSGKLIAGFNEFFKHNNLFAAEDLILPETLSPPEVKTGIFYDGVEMENPLQVNYQESGSADSFYTNCAHNIARMLNEKRFQLPQKDGSLRPVQPGDIAVLAFDKHELEKVRKELVKLNVPVVSEHKNGIWSSSEAEELALFLKAVVDPARESCITAALLTRIGGVTLAGLDKLQAPDDEKMYYWRMMFEDLQSIWASEGIASMLGKAFTAGFSGSGSSFKLRMARQQNGARSIANFTQLGDMLSAFELASHLPPRGVLNKLCEQIAGGEVDDESAEMLESDRTAVKLITIHSSKGLQYPVVFLPYMGSRYPGKRTSLKSYHRNGELCCNPDGCDHDAYMLALQEEMQELMRLAYVAVTRAGSYCFIGWGKKRSGNITVMDWLFRMRNVDFSSGSNAVLNDFLQGKMLSMPVVIPPALQYVDTAYLEAERYVVDASKEELIPPPEVKVLPNDWRLISYSALNVNDANIADDGFFDEVDRDQADDLSESSDNPLTGAIWDIPGGAAIGNAWHDILEEMDFTAPADPAAVARTLDVYGFKAPEYVTATCQMLEELMRYQFTTPDGRKAFMLQNITREQRSSEFEFLLGISGEITTGRLLEALEPYLRENYHALYQSSSDQLLRGGFFTGFIDLLFEHENRFYIVDWKSNTLKKHPANFSGEPLKKSMFEATYPLQYLFYTAALVKYLEHKLKTTITEELYDQYFGGVYYVFLRGLCLDTPCGVYNARPPLKVIKNLLDVLGCSNRKDS